MKTLKSIVLIIGIAFTILSCKDDSPVAEPQTIAEIAATDPNFSTLATALDRTGLLPVVSGEGSYTVFAPTNAAFDALGVDLALLSDQELANILLYHVLGTTVMSSDIVSGQSYVSTASLSGPNGAALSMLIEKGSDVTINGSIKVSTADIEASNGVIHVVDAVILPLDVVGHAQANANFTELVSALSTAGLVGTLKGDGPFTVFAPVNSAFEAISSTVAGLTTSELENILTYHVTGAGNVLSKDLSNGQVVNALNGGSFTINIADQVTITDGSGNNVSIVLTDVQATNGVIHVLGAVLLP